MSEQELITAVKNSDAAAFKELGKLYYRQLYGFIWRRIGDKDSVEDLLQDLFLNIWRLRNNLDEKRSVKPYLFAAANNLIKNYLKSRSLKEKRISELLPDDLGTDSHGEKELYNYLDDVLSGIPENQKIVFLMNKFEGFKYSEIAEMLNISEKTVESRMSKILKTLRDKFRSAKLLLISLIVGIPGIWAIFKSGNYN